LKLPVSGSNNESVQKRQNSSAAESLAKGVAANEAVAKKEFPNETWICLNSIRLQHEQMPNGAEGIIIAKSRLPKNPTEEHVLLKKLNRQLY